MPVFVTRTRTSPTEISGMSRWICISTSENEGSARPSVMRLIAMGFSESIAAAPALTATQ